MMQIRVEFFNTLGVVLAARAAKPPLQMDARLAKRGRDMPSLLMV
jgi:hypothetical protein